ncbi:signal peptidase II [Pseudohalioglobus lutimaris]|uniref:Lipoprotein signal peptidase n=1 Tax=Pseudohalioglobus lutimaris TaxID=1737061 RepID=A0A2N5WYZ4_9GAMM|nr:signal peptidase II [Pseudohalioglobus lutimaris]PLW67464.1 signal peptidase II [Pseudohalioglobus lutimaris]
MAMANGVVLRNGVHAWRWYLLALVLVLLDQYTKGLASASLDYGRPVQVFSWFNLTLQYNTGAAFSFLSDAGGWQRWFFTGIAVVISGALTIWLFIAPRGQWLLILSLSLILGGAIGNLWDRVVLGYVVDFISVHYRGWYFPAFNLADSAITVGAGCMLLDSFVHREKNDD